MLKFRYILKRARNVHIYCVLHFLHLFVIICVLSIVAVGVAVHKTPSVDYVQSGQHCPACLSSCILGAGFRGVNSFHLFLGSDAESWCYEHNESLVCLRCVLYKGSIFYGEVFCSLCWL